MIWSKLYGRWRKEYLDEDLAKRVRITRARYRKTHADAATAVYVTFDKQTVLTQRGSDWGHQLPAALMDIVVGLHIDDLLVDDDPLVRGFTYLDKRFGRSRIPLAMLTEIDSFARDCLRLKMSRYPDLKVNT